MLSLPDGLEHDAGPGHPARPVRVVAVVEGGYETGDVDGERTAAGPGMVVVDTVRAALTRPYKG